jgi:site-specific DNA-adenine methylase
MSTTGAALKMGMSPGTSYPGGKAGSGVYQNLINLMPPHELYIEAFLGAGAVLRHKRPATKTIGIDLDPLALERWHGDEIANLELIQGNALEWLAEAKLGRQTLVYCDPPYLMSTRRQHHRIYRCEIGTEHEHAQLLDVLLSLRCMVMISGYDSTLYNETLAGWRRSQFYTTNRSGARTVECVWMNYPTPSALHDYQFLGKGFKERERIKLKKERWLSRLQRLPALEREAVITALLEMR